MFYYQIILQTIFAQNFIQTCRALNFETELEYIYPDGCFKIVEAQFLHWLDTLIVVQVFLAIFTLIALVGSSCWIRKTRRGAIRKFSEN